MNRFTQWVSSTMKFLSFDSFVHRVKVLQSVAANIIGGNSIHHHLTLKRRIQAVVYRRKENCSCVGCTHWREVSHLREIGTPEAELPQYDLACANQYVAWTEDVYNLIPDVGANDLITQYFKAGTAPSWFCGLIDNAAFSAIANADTMASHAGWAEVASGTYSQGTRPALTLGSVASRTANNSGSVAVFSILLTTTINGAFIATNSTKNGTTGILGGAASFGSTRSVINGDTLNLTVTISA